ncbi:HAD family hydrolase [Lachnoclostridium phytofermentans]|uniref:HAD-superfamily hydrolase, subfamily IA, variant 3 n=1 Tax=Lachnoclostridium phytofermentans (strain ATCC 700394 / DSM 18823 / ISDg) TaxID=357809 RepID=A9KQL2_LACP7|nr:HAD family hydrolase [Lachnoclostridium phytofermentans]ABX41925.1 HAD-superfamily hydrolase, subfamily IA, variant 3 [Lachnoclostridium phytofermentans ISDg]
MVKAIFFDLFFTLIVPNYLEENNEYDVLKLSKEEWESYAENDVLYQERALGIVNDEVSIVKKILELMSYEATEEQITEIINRRNDRMKRALDTVDEEIIDTLRSLKSMEIKICLISNADCMDCKFWNQSPLSKFFDYAVFSCNVGMLKPESGIYNYALNRIGVKPEDSLFVGDGGSEELFGAKRVGMKTVFTEYLDKKEDKKGKELMLEADYYIDKFSDLLKII